jgi:OOP family OmpA-OmpF porin
MTITTGGIMARQFRKSGACRALMLVALLTAALPCAAADLKGSADHPLIPRHDGSEIVAYATEAFAQRRLLSAPAKHYGGLDKNRDAVLSVEGKLTSITYRAAPERSSLEVYRNYQQALDASGFVPVFECSQSECGGRNFNHAASPKAYYNGFGEYHAQQQYLLSKLDRPEGAVYAALYVVTNKAGGGPNKDRAMVQLDVVELKPMENRMVVIHAKAMEKDLQRSGRIALYGIQFDHDQDIMRADAKPQLDEIAKLLAASPQLKVLVVGHTDAQGKLDYNRELSTRRARSITEALIKDYGIDRSRLTPVGVGMAAPVASNRSEAGRAENRRVELVDLGS